MIEIIYDGECPFCNSYTRLLRLRKCVGTILLIDARKNIALATELRAKGYDLDIGMVVKWNGKIYHGAEAMHLLAMLADDRNFTYRVISGPLSNLAFARSIYPLFRGIRRLVLVILGRSSL